MRTMLTQIAPIVQRLTGDVLNMNILRHPHAWSAALAIAAILIVGGGDLSAQVIVGNGKALFNGKDLSDWDGDPRFWRVENGEIVGQTTADNAAEKNTFLI